MRAESIGFLYGIAAYTFWGVLPIYWKQFDGISSLEILCHRILWCFGFTSLFLIFDGSLWRLLKGLGKKQLINLSFSSLCIGSNWLIFVWAVQSNQIVDASLGYFICPLMMAGIGVLVLKEKLNQMQLSAIFLAAAGVLWLTFNFGRLPWIGLGLALTFSTYSFLRKTSGLNSLGGLFLETMLLTIPSLAYLGYLLTQDTLIFIHRTFLDDCLLIGAGLVTALPLWWFAHAARRLRLATLGLMQYIAPILQFLLGVMLYDEIFSHAHQIGFTMIWLGLSLYIVDQIRNRHGFSWRPFVHQD